MSDPVRDQPRAAELMAVLSMATDLGLGLPMEHTVRACLMSVELGRRVGLGHQELADLYYLSLLRMVGCTAGSATSARYFGDEVAFGRETQHLDYGDMEAFGRWVIDSFAADRTPDERRRLIERLFTYTPDERNAALTGHCEVARMLAERLGFRGAVADGLAYVFERWDGSGAPEGVPGPAQPPIARIVSLCNELEIHHRLGGPGAAVEMARRRSGAAFDPDLVATFCEDPGAVLAVADPPAAWDRLLAAEPRPYRLADEPAVLAAAAVMGDFADLKSSYLAGHSRLVADLVTAAAGTAGIEPAEILVLHVGALTQDLGRVAISTSTWDRPGPLEDSEWEAVRLHPYYSERLLARVPALDATARIAGMHHERLDGSGYHRGSRAADQPATGRLVAAADAYAAMSRPRPHRPALTPGEAARTLQELARNGLLDAGAVNSVLRAAGDTSRPVRRRWPADLTDREVAVLRRVARGRSIKEAAADLHAAPKTVDFHLQNIYSKAGISSRAAATLFAMENDLLEN